MSACCSTSALSSDQWRVRSARVIAPPAEYSMKPACPCPCAAAVPTMSYSHPTAGRPRAESLPESGALTEEAYDRVEREVTGAPVGPPIAHAIRMMPAAFAGAMLPPRPGGRASPRLPERYRVHEAPTPDICRRGEMAETSQRREPQVYEDPSGWASWVVFGGVMLILVGIFHVIQGIVALVNDDYYLVTKNGLVLNFDFTSWGWTHLVLGILIGLVGVGLLAGNSAARIAGVVLAVLSAVVNLVFIAAYPAWSVIIIALDVIVIYAIVVHGRELEANPY
jgi:hypothetical protein